MANELAGSGTSTIPTNKPFISIETKGDKKMKKMTDHLYNQFMANANNRVPRRIASKLKTKMQIAFPGSQVKTEVNDRNITMSVDNIQQLNDVLNKKLTGDVEKSINLMYQDEFEATKGVV